jgi:hypothetical protein
MPMQSTYKKLIIFFNIIIMNKLKKLSNYMSIMDDITIEDLAVSFIEMRKTDDMAISDLDHTVFNNVLTLYPEYYPDDNMLMLYALLFVADRPYDCIRLRDPEWNSDGYEPDEKYVYCELQYSIDLKDFYRHYLAHGGDPKDYIIGSMFETMGCEAPI